MPNPDHAEIAAIIGIAEANPDGWDQDAYAHRTDCGTAYCVAGWACHRRGWSMAWDTFGYANEIIKGNGQTERIEIAAARILGLSDDQAEVLFAGYNSLDNLKRIAKDLHDPGIDWSDYDGC